MSDIEAETESSVEEMYTIGTIDAADLAKLARGLLGRIADQGIVSCFATTDLLGPPKKTRTFNEFEAWAAEFVPSPAFDRAWAILRLTRSDSEVAGAKINFDIKEGRVTVTLSWFGTNQIWNIDEALHPFRERLHLDEYGIDESESIQVQKEYAFVKPFTPESFVACARSIEAKFPKGVRFSGEVTAGDRTSTSAALPRWEADMQRIWPTVERLQFSCYSGGRFFNCRYIATRGELGIETSDVDETRALELIESAVACFPSEDLQDDRRDLPLSGERRTYFLPKMSPTDWIEELPPLREEKFAISRQVYFISDCAIVRGGLVKAFTFDSFDVLLGAVKRNLSDLSSVSFTDVHRSRLLRCKFDLRRELVEVEIQANTGDLVEELFSAVTGALHLERADEPIYVARSEGTFKVVRKWDNGQLADALSATIEKFVGPAPLLAEAKIVGEDGSVTGFATLEALLVRAADSKPYRELLLRVEGPRGTALRVNLAPDKGGHSVLIRSSVEQRNFARLVRSIEDGIRLSESDPNDVEGGQQRAENTWVKVGLPIATLALGFVLSPAFFTAASADSALQITVPVAAEGAAEVAGNVLVEWDVTRKQWFRTTVERDALAHVRFIDRSGKIGPYEYPDSTPGTTFVVPEGNYDLEVVDQASNVSERIPVRVISP